MKSVSRLFLCFLLFVVFFSCKQEDESVPVISDVKRNIEFPNPGEEVVVSATVTTAGAPINLVGLAYKVNDGITFNVSMSNGGSGDVYVGTIPGQSEYGATIDYMVSASNKYGDSERVTGSYTLPLKDSFHPVISGLERTPQSPEVGDEVVVSATVTTPEGTTLSSVVLKWKVD